MKRIAAMAALLLAATGAFAAPFAYLANELNRLNVIDLATSRLVAAIPLAGQPIAVAPSRDGLRVYVALIDAASVIVVDTASNTPIASIGVCAQPLGLSINPSGTRVVVPCGGAGDTPGNQVAVIDTATNAVTTLTAGTGPLMSSWHPDGSRFYISNVDGGTISVFDGNTLAMVSTFNPPDYPFATVANAAGTRLYVGTLSAAGTQGTNSIAVLDAASGAVITTLPLDAPPSWLALNPSGTRLYVTKPDVGGITIVDTATNTVVANLSLGPSTTPVVVAFHPDGTRYYVQLTGLADLGVFDANTNQVLGAIDYGNYGGSYGLFIGPTNAPAAGPSIPGALTGLWWNPNESGWGIHFTQRGNNLFAAWYTYDAAGNPKWYVASNCTLSTAGSCTGTLYQVTGPRFFGATFNPASLVVTAAGTIALSFSGNDVGAMSYTLGGVTRGVAIERNVFARSGVTPAINYTDIWWNPAESGWGMAITQQFGIMFLAWYVYSDTGQPIWYVVPNCAVPAAGNSCSGLVYRTTGPAFAATFDPAQVRAFEAGAAIVSFTDGNNGTLSYSINGVSGSKSITRNIF